MKILSGSMAAAVFAVSMAYNPVTHADLGKAIYPASMCVQWSGNNITPRLNASRIYNDSTTRNMNVDCPVPHDDDGGLFSNDNFEDMDIGVIDDSTVANVTCWSIGAWQANTTFNSISGGNVTSSSAGLHEQNLNFGFAGGNSQTWHYIGCRVPPRQAGRTPSGITHYRANQ